MMDEKMKAMMRELKFRAFWKQDDTSLLTNKMVGPFTLGQYAYDQDGEVGANNFPSDEDIETGKALLMQFTGLNDKNGKEIFEWDIFRTLMFERRYVIRWSEILARYVGDVFEKGECIARGLLDCNKGIMQDCEVLGNIYEHPELLRNP